jgi:hypothetical protein
MSVKVGLPDLGRALEDYDYAFLACTGEQRPHVLGVRVSGDGRALTVTRIGTTAAGIVAELPGVTLVFPARDASERSLIVDGEVVGTGEGTLTVTPLNAVLHRPA